MRYELVPAIAIGAAVAAVIAPPGPMQMPDAPRALAVQANFIYGAGGTTVSAWLQTSLDGGATWIDIANFSFTTASARFVYNLSSGTPVTTEYTPTDGTLAANTAKDGLLGNMFRVKLTTTGTYTGTTTLEVDLVPQEH